MAIVMVATVGVVLAMSAPVAVLLGAALLLVGSGMRRMVSGRLIDRHGDGTTGQVRIPFTDLRVETRVYRKS